MLEKFISWLFGKKESKLPYPYCDSLREYFPHGYTPLMGLDFIRRLMKELDIGMSEADIILTIAAHPAHLDADDIDDLVTHISTERVHRLIRNLVKREYLVKVQEPETEDVTYRVSIRVKTILKSINREW